MLKCNLKFKKCNLMGHSIFNVISLITKVVNHLFMYLLATWISSFVKCLKSLLFLSTDASFSY